MKVFLMAYARTNLGDDLFIKMLLEKYPDITFYIKIPDYNFLKNMDKYNNLNILIGNDTDEELYKMEVDYYDAYVYIGGSIFMEGGKVYNLSPKFYDFVKRCKEKSIPFCYISSNYGPYHTQEYFELSRKNFQTCTDICFRDKYSYNLFKDIETVRYAPDFAFSYKMDNIDKIPNTIGISVIDLNIRNDLKHMNNDYYRFLVNNIKSFIQNDNTVYLYSFCKHEGDELIIDKLIEEFEYNPKVIAIRYNGNIEKFLQIYSKMEYMICARFHAMVLSSVFNQKIFIMSYSKKIDNVLDDLALDLPLLHFYDIKKDLILSKNNFLSVKKENMLNIIKDSEKQDLIFKINIENK